jgi:hypothetical protein
MKASPTPKIAFAANSPSTRSGVTSRALIVPLVISLAIRLASPSISTISTKHREERQHPVAVGDLLPGAVHAEDLFLHLEGQRLSAEDEAQLRKKSTYSSLNSSGKADEK